MSTAQASGNSQQGLVHWAAHQLVDDWAVSAFSRLSKIYGCDFKVNALEDDNDRIRRIALFGLRVDCESDPRTLQALITALNDPDSSVRADAARHLCGMKNPEAIEPLIDAITNDDSEDVWRNAARALRGMGEQAVEVLIPILDKNSRRGSVARYQLTLMTGQDFGFRKKKWMKWWEENKDIVVLSE